MLRKICLACAAILAREGQRVLQDLNAPDFATLLRRITFWVRFYIGCSIILGGIVAIEEVFGLAAMWIAVAGVYLFHIWLLNRTGGGYAGNAGELLELIGDSPPPPGKPQLPPSGAPQIGRACTAIARRSSNTSPTVSGRQDNNSRPGPLVRR
jgi:hypothetical protein